jgi:amiloride-sensitive sodium channel
MEILLQFVNFFVTANTGGLLGLFLGFSFLSAVEAIYFITIRLWCSINQRNQNVAKSQKSLLVTNSNHVSIVNPYPFAQ